jgi:hypothetical protein
MATADDDVLAGNVAAVVARRSGEFTRFDGNLAGLAVPSPVDGVTSATRLQTWAACPFAYFVESILRVEPVENPEDALEINRLDKGLLVHEALERFIVEILARPPDAQPSPDRKWTREDHERMAEIGAEL